MPSPIARVKFGMVLLTHRKRLRDKALQVCARPSDADDLVQETIAKVLVSLERVRTLEPGVIYAYLVATMRNVFIDQCRRQRIELLQGALHPVEPELDLENPEVEVEYWRRLDDDALRAAEASLSDRQRQAWALRRADLSYQEIARQMGLTTGAVGKLLFDAREKVRKTCLKRL